MTCKEAGKKLPLDPTHYFSVCLSPVGTKLLFPPSSAPADGVSPKALASTLTVLGGGLSGGCALERAFVSLVPPLLSEVTC